MRTVLIVYIATTASLTVLLILVIAVQRLVRIRFRRPVERRQRDVPVSSDRRRQSLADQH